VTTVPATTPTSARTTSTAVTSGAGSATGSQAPAGGGSTDNAIYAVAAVCAIVIMVAAFALRRKH
jgi:hypothetical protein